MKNKIITKRFLIFIIIIQVCLISCDNKVHKDDLVGTYRLKKTIGLDSHLASIPNWVLKLERKNNFSLKNSRGTVNGYWALQVFDGKSQILLNSLGINEIGEFNGYQIKFSRPNNFLDSNLSEAIFEKE